MVRFCSWLVVLVLGVVASAAVAAPPDGYPATIPDLTVTTSDGSVDLGGATWDDSDGGHYVFGGNPNCSVFQSGDWFVVLDIPYSGAPSGEAEYSQEVTWDGSGLCVPVGDASWLDWNDGSTIDAPVGFALSGGFFPQGVGPVPEAASLGLMALGLPMLLGRSRCRSSE